MPGELQYLNYQGATYKRSRNLILFAVLGILFCLFIKIKPQVPVPGTVEGPPISKTLVGFASIIMAFSGVVDLCFVFYQKNLRKEQFAFDQESLYVIGRASTEKIPLSGISEIALTTTSSHNNNRGYSSMYRISYNNSYSEEKAVRINIYSRMRGQFEDFRKAVLLKNPSVKIKNGATGLDWIFRIVKKVRR